MKIEEILEKLSELEDVCGFECTFQLYHDGSGCLKVDENSTIGHSDEKVLTFSFWYLSEIEFAFDKAFSYYIG